MSSKNETKIVHEEEEEDEIKLLQYKVILLGDGAVGKTSIAQRFTENNFYPQYKQTIGVDFFLKRIELPNNHQVTLQIWDIGGQSLGSKMLPSYISGADAILYVCDITNRSSFIHIEDWHRLALESISSNNDEDKKNPFMAILGNKNDLRHISVVSGQELNRFAEENGLASFSLSAKSGDMVLQVFSTVAASLSGVSISKVNLEHQSLVVPALIIDHERHDQNINNGQVPNYTKSNYPFSNCTIS